MSHTSSSTERADVYTRITAEIVAAMEAGAGEWRMPWHHDGTAITRPQNISSGNRYRGVNVLALWIAAQARGYANGLWGTYRQWLAVSAQVRKGERGTTVVLWKQAKATTNDDADDGDDDVRRRVFARAFTVFNVAQVDGYEPQVIEKLPEGDRLTHVGEFIDALAKVEGKFIAVLNPTPENVAAFKKVGHVFRLKVREASGRGGAKHAMRLFVANFPVRKAAEFELVAKCEHLPLDPSVDELVFDKPSRLVKGIDPNDERFVLGIVLEPEVVDAQGDIYSAEEIRAAAHRFMEDFGGLGLMHRLRVNGQVKVLESYLAPTDFTIGELAVRKGTWLLAVRVLSDELWERVKSGDLTGFSIGGSARRVPEAVPTSEQPSAADTITNEPEAAA